VARVQVIGVGSPLGDDRLGWRVAELLGKAVESDAVSIRICDRPGALLLDAWGDAERLVLVDAMRSGARPGSLHRLAASEIGDAPDGASSHGFGVAAALALARALGRDLSQVTVFGVEMSPEQQGDALSEPVRAALPALAEQIAAEIAHHVAG
jgi:hydrogenase maturation protease